MIVLFVILGLVLIVDLTIFGLRERIAGFFATHFQPSSDSLLGLDELKKWRK